MHDQAQDKTPPQPEGPRSLADGTVLYDVRDGVGWITLNRPEARNALTYEMYDAIAGICRSAPEDGSLKAIVITGVDEKAFGAGTDMTLFRAFSKPEDAIAYEERMERVFSAIESCKVPTIAAISGACTGGGAVLAVTCDIRVAAERSRFGFPIARTLGNCLSLANYARLTALIGAGRVIDMVLLARLISAEEAKAAGLVSEVLQDHAAVVARAAEMAETVGGHAPLTMRATKEALRRLRRGEQDGSDLVVECYMSADFREGMEAFLGKRKPIFKGR